MASSDSSAIAIVGGGLAGLCAALGCARTGRRVHLFAPDGPEDERTTAILVPTVEALRGWGVWDAIEPETAPLRTMRIIDGSRRLVRAPTVSFEAAEIGQSEFGRNVPNRVATAALREALATSPNVVVHPHEVEAVHHDGEGVRIVANGEDVEVGLVVGADGHRSIVRRAANIGARSWSYPQAAIVTTFSHERAHGDVSMEFHTENGPATQVPLPGDRSSLVWVTEPAEAQRLASMDRAALSSAVEERLAHTLGRVRVDGPVTSFPMRAMLADHYAGRRTVLVGEAAHAFPPIGAQGFNLTMRDVVDLVQLQHGAADPGSYEITGAYAQFRGRDASLRTFAVDALNRSLLSGLLPVQAAKALGLGALKAVPPLRRAVMREGFQPRVTRMRSAADAANLGLAALREAFRSGRARRSG